MADREVHLIPTHGSISSAVRAETADEALRPELLARRAQSIGRHAVSGIALWVASLVLAMFTLNLHGVHLNWTHFLAITTAVIALALMGTAVRNMYRLTSSLRGSANMGSYKLEKLLGRGGMGEVWSAKHRLLARPAAVKLIKARAMGAGSSSGDIETARVRFAREAQAIARLSSPHTVQLYDFGIAENGDFYYVMELLHGFTMEQMVERWGQIDAARVIYLIVQAAESLAEAHQAGLVHRDVKPANIFVCRYGTRYDFVKVLDFGLVKDRTREHPESVTVTSNGTITGTPAYMAPEIALGKVNIDARADIYSLGCVAYWLLTGKQIFEGDTLMEVLVKHVNQTPPSISSLVELPLPPGLEECILRCIAKDPDERPQTMDELIHDLLSVAADAPWNFARARRWWEAHVPDVPAIGATGADSVVRDRAVDRALKAAAVADATTKP